MGKLAQEMAATVNKMDNRLDTDLFNRIEQRMIHRVVGLWVRQCLTNPFSSFLDLNMFILTRNNPLIHCD